MTAQPKHRYSLKDYYDLEKNSEEKFEYWDGNVWSMAGASPAHERVVSNLIFHLRTILKRNCSVFGSNLKVKVPIYAPYRYPDLTVYCGQGIYEMMDGLEVLTNPQMLIEVLSPSTEAFDRGDKFSYYKSIESFTDYLLIAANRPYVTHFMKQNENEWVQREASGLNGKLILSTFEVEISLSEIYLDIEFPEDKQNLFLVDR